MNVKRYLLASLTHYWRTNLAVLLGVVAATAVIAGALVVGDSVRGSLRQMSLDRLGGVDFAMNVGRFFREDLANDIAADETFADENKAIAPAIVVSGSLELKNKKDDDSDQEIVSRVSKVNIYGTDDRLWNMIGEIPIDVPVDGGVVLNQKAADELQAKVGDDITLYLEIPSSIPRDTLFGERDETTEEISLKVTAIAADETSHARFSLLPNQQLPVNAFVSLRTLQDRLGLAGVERTKRNPFPKPAKVNAMFVSSKDTERVIHNDIWTSHVARSLLKDLKEAVTSSLTLEDIDLRLMTNEDHGYIAVESERMILEKSLGESGLSAAEKLKADTSPVLVYLANELANANELEKFSMYSIVAGIDPSQQSPFGPLVTTEDKPLESIPDGKIAINDWLAKDMNAKAGDTVRMKYHPVGSYGDEPEEIHEFEVAAVLKLDGTPIDDAGFTPYVKGVTDADSFDDWDQPFEMDLNRVTQRDEDYWDDRKATPKAFVSLTTAQELWNSRYGELTSLRIAPPSGTPLNEFRETFKKKLLEEIDPTKLGFVFQPIKMQGVAAASGTTDFTGLFVGFSFFLIFSAAILVALLFRLGVEQRVRNIGLLAAVGFTERQVRRMFLLEGLVIVLIGGVVGMAAAVGYAAIMIHGLKTWWIGAIGTKFLFLYVNPVSLLIGFAIAVLISLFVIWWSLRALNGISIRDLLYGVTQPVKNEVQTASSRNRSGMIGLVCGAVSLLLLIVSLIGLVPASEAFSGLSWQVVTFFLSGMLSLTAGLFLMAAWLNNPSGRITQGKGLLAETRLGISNASRHQQRTLVTASLIASASFVVVAVAAGQYNPTQLEPELNSGNGGFTLVSESSRPLLYDWETKKDRQDLEMFPQGETDEQTALFKASKTIPFLVQPGEDASCLNLYQTRVPTILGVPDAMIERGGFAFADTPGENPWTILKEQREDGSIPVMGDMNTLMFSLHKPVGESIDVPHVAVPDATLHVSGMFTGSVFQGVLVMSEANFRKLFPDVAGYQYFLTEVPPDKADELSSTLETGLVEYGLDVEHVADRLRNFLAVQNTYLSTFQTLGGLGLLLGTLGLGTVMLRNVFERRSEMALFRAIGFGKAGVSTLVLVENAFLLVCGLLLGTVSALIAMMPHLASSAAAVPWDSILQLLAIILVVGMLTAVFAVIEAIRTPIVATLRGE